MNDDNLFDSLEVGMEVIDQIKQLNFDVEPFIRYMPNQKAFIGRDPVF